MSTHSLYNLVPEITLAAALAWGSGIRLYAVLLILGLSGYSGWLDLPPHLAVLAHPLVLCASGFMTLVEFGADKVPWIDSVWDAVHTLIRVPAGAALAAAVFGAGDASITGAAAILGGTIAAGTHFAKAGGRAALNASPEPFSNWAASFAEDVLVPSGLWLAVAHPAAFLVALALFALAALVLARALVTGLGMLMRGLRARMQGVP